jgi:MoxR-like ATPase
MISEQHVKKAQEIIGLLRKTIAERLVGQADLVNGLLTGLIASGHVLVEGAPGLAKTLAVNTMAHITHLDFKRIQFTPDLLPADIVGTMVYNQGSGTFTTKKGPIFANLILADEINRAPAKVQSALLEAMAEKQVTIGGETHKLPSPFLVLATQNPIEQEGAYQLPEAQLDRFLIKVKMSYPTPAEELQVLRLVGIEKEAEPLQVIKPTDLVQLKTIAESISVDESIERYIVSLVAASRSKESRLSFSKLIEYGASPRATIALYRCAKVRALFAGRSFVVPDDVKASVYEVMRHRIVLSYDAEAEEMDADDVIGEIVAAVAVP